MYTYQDLFSFFYLIYYILVYRGAIHELVIVFGKTSKIDKRGIIMSEQRNLFVDAENEVQEAIIQLKNICIPRVMNEKECANLIIEKTNQILGTDFIVVGGE